MSPKSTPASADAAQALQDDLNNRAEAFSKQFAKATYEMGEAQNFIRELCGVYGLNYLRSVDFERRIQKSSGRGINRIDGFFPGQLLIEMKSAGQDLQEAYEQAKGYLPLLKNPVEMPRYILVSDFQNLHLYDLQAAEAQKPLRFPLAHFRQHVNALDFLLGYVPLHSSENRRFIPIGYFGADVICGNANAMLPNATQYEFGMLCSTMHNAWMRSVCGRLESRYRYSNTIVYNNYPWPQALTPEARVAVEDAAKAVLTARDAHPDKSLAWLYNPDTMPANLRDAHDALDVAVDDAYGYMGRDDDADRVAFLFERYRELTTLLPSAAEEANVPDAKKRKPRSTQP